MTGFFKKVAPWITSLTLLTGCQKESGGDELFQRSKQHSETPKSRVVARIGARAITEADLKRAIEALPPHLRLRYSSAERRQEFLNNLVRLEVLAAEARRRGLHRQPEVVQQVKRTMVEQLVQQLKDELVSMESVTPAAIAAYYQQHQSRYHQPAKRRAQLIVVDQREQAKRLFEQLTSTQSQQQAAQTERILSQRFARLADQQSVQPSKRKAGDLGYFSADDPQIPQTLRAAAFSASTPFPRLVGPISLGTPAAGYAVLLVTAERPAVDISLDDARDRIKNLLFSQKQTAALKAYLAKLRKAAKVEIIGAKLDAIDTGRTPAQADGRRKEGPRETP
ncbi:MAG: peptidyl-prolyl cis-trans isomerase [Deltaproteobacteria bacterium]|nr:peptidyl-prolyl cis-trans isomerase [Deltaproteobacteria bacterium]